MVVWCFGIEQYKHLEIDNILLDTVSFSLHCSRLDSTSDRVESHRSSTNWNFVSAHIWHMNVKLHPKMLNCGKCRNPILEMIIYISKKNTFPTIVSLLFSLLDA